MFPVKDPLVHCLLPPGNSSKLLHLGRQSTELGWLFTRHKQCTNITPLGGNKYLNHEAGMRRVAVGNAQSKGQESVGSFSVSGREGSCLS